MIRLVRAEFGKLTTTRWMWWLLVGYLAYAGFNMVLLILLAGQQGVPPLTDPDELRTVLASTISAVVFPLVVGVVLLTTEYRNRTIATSFLVTPRRGRVVTAKVVVGFVVGLLFGVVGVAFTLAVTAPLLAYKDVSVHWAGDPLDILGGCVVVATLYTVLGVGLGALIRNQVAAVLVAVLGSLLVDSLVAQFLPEVGRYWPAGAAGSLTQGIPSRGVDFLPPWGGALVLIGWAVTLAVVGTFTTVRRDVT